MATNHEVGSSILSGRTSFPCQPGMPEIPRFARDFACGLPLRSRPQSGSSSILSGRTISLPVHRREPTSLAKPEGDLMKGILWAVCLMALVLPASDLRAQVNPYRIRTVLLGFPGIGLKFWLR